ncbi:MAG TPA: amylo-alpha-1,6-glucosidase [Bryobacteraceae bacterium]|nr:amylo-alpha-1,6-glucosidase [Bryobacteraceae bacterium]
MKIPAELCRDFARSSKIEWLETNGTGAFAMGTVAGLNTRRYHALLLASLRPPVQRYVLLSRVEEEADGCALGACQYPGVVTPRGFEFLEEFESEPCATWRFRIGAARLEKQVYLIDGRQAVVVRYRADRAMKLRVRPFFAYRDYHSVGRRRDDLFGGLPRMEFHHNGRFIEQPDWYYNVEYLVELERGLDFREDLFTPGVIEMELQPGEWSPIVAAIEPAAYAEPSQRDDPFLVRRADGSPTIVAGYPWFTDWGRDTMISLPGLLIAGGKRDSARQIIEGFLAHRHRGVIPNRFPDSGETPEYNTADATLWMFRAVRALSDAGGDVEFFRAPAREIVECLLADSADPADLLLRAPPGHTWMDARVADRAVTPRAGKPVEINALWYEALLFAGFDAEADRVRENFAGKFWNQKRGCLYDLIDGEGAEQIRPNQIFAVRMLDRERARSVVRVVERELLAPQGLRTLARDDPQYIGRYEGGPAQRDSAYHQGTVWPWLIGGFIDAYLLAFGKSEETLTYCRELVQTVEASGAGCLGSIAEIFDGDEPRFPRGCPAQAWSVAEVARVKALLGL